MEKHHIRILTILGLALCLPAFPGLARQNTNLTNSGNLTNLSLFEWARELEKASGVKIVLEVTNPTSQRLRLPANWRSGRSLERSLQDLTRLWPELSWKSENNLFILGDSTNQGFGSGSLSEHLFSLTKAQGLAGGIAIFGQESLLSVGAPLEKPANLSLDRHLDNLGRFYGFLDYRLSEEALTLQLFDDNHHFTKEIDNEDGTPLIASSWPRNTFYLVFFPFYQQAETSFTVVSRYGQSSVDFSSSPGFEAGWFFIKDLFISAAIKTTHFQTPNYESGSLFHFSLGAHYMFELWFFRCSVGLELMLDEHSADSLELFAEDKEVNSLIHPVILGRFWFDILGPVFVLADLGLGPNYIALTLGAGLKL